MWDQACWNQTAKPIPNTRAFPSSQEAPHALLSLVGSPSPTRAFFHTSSLFLSCNGLPSFHFLSILVTQLVLKCLIQPAEITGISYCTGRLKHMTRTLLTIYTLFNSIPSNISPSLVSLKKCKVQVQAANFKMIPARILSLCPKARNSSKMNEV